MLSTATDCRCYSVGVAGALVSEILAALRCISPRGHRYTEGEDDERAQPETVDLAKLVSGLRNTVSAGEVTLDGMRSVNTTATRQRFPASIPDRARPAAVTEAANGDVTVKPFELRTFRMA